MNLSVVRALLSWVLLEGVAGEAKGDEFKKEQGELDLTYDETLDHYVIQIHKNQV
jgi:hypothetical protein